MSETRSPLIVTRRALVGSLAVASGGLLSGCDALNANQGWRDTLRLAETGNMALQRAIQGAIGWRANIRRAISGARSPRTERARRPMRIISSRPRPALRTGR